MKSPSVRRSPRFFRIALTTLVLVLLYAFFLNYGLNKMHSSQDQAKQIQSTADQTNAKASKGELVKANQSQYDNRTQTANSALPADLDLDSAINQISLVATSAGVSWTAGTPAATGTDTGAGAKAYSLSMSITGPVPNINQFLQQLRALPRLITVQAASVSVTQEGGTDTTTASISASLYTYASGGNG